MEKPLPLDFQACTVGELMSATYNRPSLMLVFGFAYIQYKFKTINLTIYNVAFLRWLK